MLWSAAGLLLLALILLEALLQLAHRLRRTPDDPRTACDGYPDKAWLRAHLADCNALEFAWQPYTGFRHQPRTGGTVTVDADGLRKDGGAGGDIWMFGGSTVFGVGASDRATIPALLSAALGRPVRNLGAISYVSSQEVIALAERLKRGERPALIILYDGVNDAICAAQSGQPGWPYAAQNRAREFMIGGRRGPLLRLALAAWLPRLAKGLGKTREPPPPPQPAAEAVVELYQQNVRQVLALGQCYGFATVAAWQPILYGKRNKTPYEAEIAQTFAAEAARYCEAVYAARRSVSPLPGQVHLGDLLDAATGTQFLDPFHLTEVGNAEVAMALLPHVRAALGDKAAASG